LILTLPLHKSASTIICMLKAQHSFLATRFYEPELEGGRNNFFEVPIFEVHKGDLCC
jgi:hypothetical protein